MTATDISTLRLSLKWAWIGPAAGIACMVALFIVGLATQTSGRMVVAVSVAAALCGVWVAVIASLRRAIVQKEQR
jgi:hypothetical protein